MHGYQCMREEGNPLCSKAAEVLPTRLFPNFLLIDFFNFACKPSMIFLYDIKGTITKFPFLV